MKTLVQWTVAALALAIVMFSGLSHAGPYVSVMAGGYRADAPAATAGITSYQGGELNRGMASLGVGYEGRAGWFVDANLVRFSALDHYEAQFTSGGMVKNVMSFYNAEAHEKASTYAFNVGKTFTFGALSVAPFVGVHYFTTSASAFARTVALDEATSAALLDDYRAVASERSDFAADVGVGLRVPLTDSIAAAARYTHYFGIERDALEVGVRVEF